MAFAVVALILTLLSVLAGGVTRLSFGVFLVALSLFLSLPLCSGMMDRINILPTLADVLLLMLITAGLSLVCTSWRIPLGERVLTISIPTILFMVVSVGSIFIPLLTGTVDSPGTFGLDPLMFCFTVICLFAALRIAYISHRLVGMATHWLERVVLASVRASMVMSGMGVATCMVSLFAQMSNGSMYLQNLENPGISLGLAGACGVMVSLCVAAAAKFYCMRCRRRALKKLLPEITDVWEKVLYGHERFIYPAMKLASVGAGYRMLIEIRDVVNSDAGLAETLDETDYLLLERAEDLLAGQN